MLNLFVNSLFFCRERDRELPLQLSTFDSPRSPSLSFLIFVTSFFCEFTKAFQLHPALEGPDLGRRFGQLYSELYSKFGISRKESNYFLQSPLNWSDTVPVKVPADSVHSIRPFSLAISIRPFNRTLQFHHIQITHSSQPAVLSTASCIINRIHPLPADRSSRPIIRQSCSSIVSRRARQSSVCVVTIDDGQACVLNHPCVFTMNSALN